METDQNAKATIRQNIRQRILNNDAWYGDGPPDMADSFNAEKTSRRRDLFVGFLRRAARCKQKSDVARNYNLVADKLEWCPVSRCGSSSCPECRRAFQRAFASAAEDFIHALTPSIEGKLVFISIIPVEYCFPVGTLSEFEVSEFNADLLNRFNEARIDLPFIAGTDFSIEKSAGGVKFWQPHWHISTWAENQRHLSQKLTKLFTRSEEGERVVHILKPKNLNFLVYAFKGFKIIELLRSSKRALPELLLNLDKIDPLDMVVSNRSSLFEQKRLKSDWLKTVK